MIRKSNRKRRRIGASWRTACSGPLVLIGLPDSIVTFCTIYVMDRGYVDFGRLHGLHLAGAFFVTRAKSNMDSHRVYSAPADSAAGIICDQTIALGGHYTAWPYRARLGLGDIQVERGDLGVAKATYREAAAIADRLAKADPGNAGWQYDLGISNERIGNVQMAQGDLAAALKVLRRQGETS